MSTNLAKTLNSIVTKPGAKNPFVNKTKKLLGLPLRPRAFSCPAPGSSNVVQASEAFAYMDAQDTLIAELEREIREAPMLAHSNAYHALLHSLSDAGIEVVEGRIDPAQFDKCLFCKCTSGTHVWACPRNNAAGKIPSPSTDSAERDNGK